MSPSRAAAWIAIPRDAIDSGAVNKTPCDPSRSRSRIEHDRTLALPKRTRTPGGADHDRGRRFAQQHGVRLPRPAQATRSEQRPRVVPRAAGPSALNRPTTVSVPVGRLTMTAAPGSVRATARAASRWPELEYVTRPVADPKNGSAGTGQRVRRCSTASIASSGELPPESNHDGFHATASTRIQSPTRAASSPAAKAGLRPSIGNG